MSVSADLVASLALICVCAGVAAAHRVSRGARSFARVEQQGGTVVLGAGLMNAGYWFLQPAVRACVRCGVSPGTISWASLAPAALAGVAAAGGHWGVAAWGLWASAMLDVLDGAVARAAGSASHRGAILDSVLDRYAEFFFFAGVMTGYRDAFAVQMLCVAALFGSLMVTYSTAKAEALRLTPPRGCMKRSDRLTLLVVGALLAPFSQQWLEPAGTLPAWPVLAVVALIAVLANVSAIARFKALSRGADA